MQSFAQSGHKLLLVGVENWLVSMISERFMELVERVSMCGVFVAS